MEDKESQSDWSEIPDDILLKITELITMYSDYIRLRVVCLKWRTTLPYTPPHTLPSQLPWLLLPPSHPSRRAFYNIITHKLYSLFLPESSNPRRILGSSHGYLILTSGTPDILCFNPLTKLKMLLPPLSTLPGVISFSFIHVGREYLIQDQLQTHLYPLDLKQMRDDFFRKIVLSSSPSNGFPSFAFAITTSFVNKTTELVFCTIGEDLWFWVPVSDFSAEDVIYCQSEGLFYAVDRNGDVGGFRVGADGVCEVIIWQTAAVIPGDLRYLALLDGRLVLLIRHMTTQVDIRTYCEVYQTVGFEVYRFHEYESGKVSWEMVEGLGDKVVFIGESSSMAFSASDFPGCKGNCIYFTDDHCKSNDVGVYDFGEERIDALPCFPEDASLPLDWEPPIWITPNPH